MTEEELDADKLAIKQQEYINHLTREEENE
jgi:hypothetical protein|nr:MAG TPA: hypothetical protein [Caudoviricetes sp.]DAQ38363.1 MAG TPA: hypothetical protein [Caudoviricetes sp.]